MFQEEDLSKNLTFSKKYNSIFERKRFLWKSLYEIRRNRLNNKDVGILNILLNINAIYLYVLIDCYKFGFIQLINTKL